MRSDLIKETAPHREGLFQPKSNHQQYEISFEDLIESDGFFSMYEIPKYKPRKSAPGNKAKGQSTYKIIAAKPIHQE